MAALHLVPDPPEPHEIEPIKVGKTDLDPSVHDGVSFIDRITGYGHRILGMTLHKDNPNLADAELVVSEDDIDLTPPVPVVVELGQVKEAHSFKVFLKEHEKVAKAATGLSLLVGVGSLVVYRKTHKNK